MVSDVRFTILCISTFHSIATVPLRSTDLISGIGSTIGPFVELFTLEISWLVELVSVAVLFTSMLYAF